MAIVTEITNYANTEIPYIQGDSSLLMPYINNNVKTKTITLNNKSITYKSGSCISIPIGYHISNYTRPLDGIEYIEYAIKSKKTNPQYDYFMFTTLSSGRSSISLKICVNKDVSIQNYNNLNYMSTVREGNMNLAIVEVGEYIGIMETWDARSAYGSMGVQANYLFVSKNSIEEILGTLDGRTYDTEFGGVSDADGYDPNFDNSSDIIPVPNMPSVGVSNVGFVNVYKTSQGALQNLGADLFPDFVPPPTPEPTEDLATTIAMGFTNVVENLSNLLSSYINSNLINYIIDCHCLPVSPTVGESEPIKIGFKSFPQSAFRVTSDYVDFNCGTLSLKEYYGNFIDYVGTRASLYLPFIGFVPIKNEYFQDGELNVKYRFNIIDGSFMAYVLATSSKSNLKDTVIGTYSGNACVHIPITGVNYSNMVSGLVNGATAIASASKGVGGVAINTALSTLSMKPEMQGNNSYNATSSFLGIRYPYLLIEREVSNFSELYPNEYGVPLNATKTISELTGYVEMDENIHIELNCMDEERQMILELLTGGIII